MRSRVWWRGLAALLVLWMLVPPVHAQQGGDPVQQLMAAMPTRMKVGQLLLVSFPDVDVGAESEIAALIRDYALGGVLLSPRNGNFGAEGVADPAELIVTVNQLQQAAWTASQQWLSSPLEDDLAPSPLLHVPLFVAVEAEVSGLPITALIAGTTPQPTPLSLGATWSVPLSESAGQAVGRELAALGVNLFLGPDLDVLHRPNPGNAADLGIRSFGGDPFWVGELGQAYIQGLHQGSHGRLAVVPRHFPGLGSADRLLQEEIPTIQKPLGQLKQIELAPFYAVASDDPRLETIADGFLVTHIRYRGFQDNLRAATRPISLDAAALQLALADVRPWRDAGGVLISDNLGLASVHRLYDPRGSSFSGRRVVQDALTAGNDLLILDNFATDNADWDAHFANIRDVLEYLVLRYEDDPSFQEQVDTALVRILSLKLRLYPNLTLNQVLVEADVALTELGLARGLTAQVATRAITRLAPFSDDLLPTAPQAGERIVVFTQEHPVTLVAGAVTMEALSKEAVSQAMLRLYGPEGTGQIRQGSIQVFTFEDLASALAAEPPFAPDSPAIPVLVALEQARWIVFATTGLDTRDPVSGALKNFLAQRTGLASGQIVVLAFGTPYDLDSTEISKVDVYYALYSPRNAFVEVAVRALFRDIVASGASPVNIPAINYDLIVQTTPDSNQIITLSLVDIEGNPLDADHIRKDDVVYLRTGVILDRNGYPVPDGTPAQFILSYLQEGIEQRIAAEVREGVAMTSVTLDRVGQLDFTVLAEPALASFHIQLTVREDQSGPLVTIMPTATPTPPVPVPTPDPEPPPKEQMLPEPLHLPAPQRVALWVWGGCGVLLCVLGGGFWAHKRACNPVSAVRLGLWCGIAGSCGYALLMLLIRQAGAGAYYQLATHEHWAGGIALLAGALMLIAVFLFVTPLRLGRQQ